MTEVCISGVGGYVPAGRRTNAELAAQLGVAEAYIVKLTGIRERCLAAPEEATSDLALHAARAALQNACVDPSEVDGLIVATATADYVTPSAANLLQHRLGLRQVPSYDLNAGCTGSIYALITAAGLIQAGFFRGQPRPFFAHERQPCVSVRPAHLARDGDGCTGAGRALN